MTIEFIFVIELSVMILLWNIKRFLLIHLHAQEIRSWRRRSTMFSWSDSGTFARFHVEMKTKRSFNRAISCPLKHCQKWIFQRAYQYVDVTLCTIDSRCYQPNRCHEVAQKCGIFVQFLKISIISLILAFYKLTLSLS